MKARFVAAAAVAALIAGSSGTLAQEKTFELKLSHWVPASHPLQKALEEWGAAVEKDSGGRIKGEVYPASQLGSIPRQIEGAQFGSIQAWIGPPEFLVGVDERYETLSVPGLFASQDQDIRVLTDPAVRDLMLGLGANKGLAGIGLFPLSPSAIVARKPVRHLAGANIRLIEL